jgi:subtilisin family serine protease
VQNKKRKKNKTFMVRVSALLVLAAASIVAQRVPGRYLVELKTAPVVELMSKSRPPATRQQISIRRSEIENEQAQVSREIGRQGGRVVHTLETAANVLTVETSAEGASRLSGIANVRKVHPVYLVHPSLDRVQVLHKVLDAWQTVGGRDHAGAGVKIAIIDTGIDTAHAGFQDDSLVAPPGFPKFRNPGDQSVVNGKVIVARSYDDLYGRGNSGSASDCYGHGTGVAMAAAGTPVKANYAEISGVAPKAFLGAYRVFQRCVNSAYDDVVLRAINDAIDDGMDVINLSLGSSFKDLAGEAVFDQAFQRASDAGIVVVTTAGNSGPDPVSLDSPGMSPHVITVGASINDRTFRFPVRAEGLETILGMPGSGPNSGGDVSGQVVDVAGVEGNSMGCIGYADASLSGKIALIPRGDCDFSVKLNFAASAGAKGALVVNSTSGVIEMYVGTATLPAMMISREDGATLRGALVQNPGLNVSIGFSGEPVLQDSRQLAMFSSRGPSVLPDRSVKPDLLAIGQDVYTATSTNVGAGIYDASGFALLNGTSYSAPIVAGAAAVLKAARPGLTAQQYRSLLINNAVAFSTVDGRQYTPVEGGAGLLNLDASLKSSLTLSSTSISYGLVSGGSFDLSKEVTMANTGTADETVDIDVEKLSAGLEPRLDQTHVTVPAGGTIKLNVQMQSTDLAPGAYQGWIRFHGRTSGAELRMPYWLTRPSGIASSVVVMDISPENPARAQEVEVMFRVLDTTSIPINSAVEAISLTRGAWILHMQNQDSDTPGAWLLRFRTASLPATNRISIHRDNFTRALSFITR